MKRGNRYMVNYKPNCVSSCIIIAEIYEEEYRIYTSIEEIQKCKDIIEEVYKGRCKRVYISGFELVKENDNPDLYLMFTDCDIKGNLDLSKWGTNIKNCKNLFFIPMQRRKSTPPHTHERARVPMAG